jgi:hypothetical protein
VVAGLICYDRTMMRVGLIAMVLSAHARVVAASPCTPQDKADAIEAATNRSNEARFARTLAARKLKPVALKEHRLASGVANDKTPDGYTVDRVMTLADGGAQVTVVIETMGAPPDFVRQGAKIFRAVRTSKVGKKIEGMYCGCPVPHFTGGGAAVPRAQPTSYELPAGTTWAGTVAVEHVYDWAVFYTDEKCPMIQPPPAAAP